MPLPTAHVAAFAQMPPEDFVTVTVAYPAVLGEENYRLFSSRLPSPPKLDPKSRYNTRATIALTQVMRSPLFAATVFGATSKVIGSDRVMLAPYYASPVGPLLYPSEQAMGAMPTLVADVRVYSFGLSERSALTDQKREALTLGRYFTPTLGLALRQQGARNATHLLRSPFDPPAAELAAFDRKALLQSTTRRMAVSADQWTAYLRAPARAPDPLAPWGKATASQIRSAYARVVKSRPQAIIGEAYGRTLFGGCATEIANKFEPAAWAKLIRASLLAERKLRRVVSEASYNQVVSGTYGEIARAQFQRETMAVERFERTRAQQRSAGLFNGVLNVMAGVAMSNGATSSRVSGYDLANLQTQMFSVNEEYKSSTRARNRLQSTGLNALSRLAQTTGPAQVEAVTILGAGERTVRVATIEEVREASGAAILDLAGYPS